MSLDYRYQNTDTKCSLAPDHKCQKHKLHWKIHEKHTDLSLLINTLIWTVWCLTIASSYRLYLHLHRSITLISAHWGQTRKCYVSDRTTGIKSDICTSRSSAWKSTISSAGFRSCLTVQFPVQSSSLEQPLHTVSGGEILQGHRGAHNKGPLCRY